MLTQVTDDLLPARLVTLNGATGFANEVGPHNPALIKRFCANPVTRWSGEFLEGDDRHPTPEFHIDIDDDLINVKRGVWRAPRSYAKTTKIRNYISCLACNYKRIKRGDFPGLFPHSRVRLISCAGAKARETLMQVRDVLDYNPNVVAEYGKLEGEKWTEDHLITSDGFEVTAAGRGAQVRGFRPTLLLLDDLDDDEEVQSDERLEKAFTWFDKAVYNTLDEDDYQCFVIGTTLEEVSLLNYIADKPSFEDHTLQAYIGGIQEPGRELWPSKWPHDKLVKREADIGRRAFMSEFMNVPQPSESPIFERHWFKPYEPDSAMFQKLLDRSMFTIECCDPAISRKDGADYSALVTVSVTFETLPKIYLRTGGVKRGHWSLPRTVTEIFNLYEKFYANEVGVEEVAYQMALGDEIDAFMENNQRNIRTIRLTPDGDKERRANAVVPFVERGQVFYDPDDPMHKRLIDECVLFKPGKINIKKDLMDAFVYCLHRVKIWQKMRERGSGAIRVLPHGRKPHRLTGT